MHRWKNCPADTLIKSPHHNRGNEYVHNCHCPFFSLLRGNRPCAALCLSTRVWSVPCSFHSINKHGNHRYYLMLTTSFAEWVCQAGCCGALFLHLQHCDVVTKTLPSTEQAAPRSELEEMLALENHKWKRLFQRVLYSHLAIGHTLAGHQEDHVA